MSMDFVAVHESASGTSRQFTPTHQLVAIGGIADMPRTLRRVGPT
jgi:hypothetical protein